MNRVHFEVPVKHDIIKPKNCVLGDLIPAVNKWSATMASNFSGPGVKLNSLTEIAVNTETGQWRITGTEEINGDVWFYMPPTLITDFMCVVDSKMYPRQVPLFSIEECVANVEGWSKARGIIDNGKWFTQVTKFYEEDGEAATGISKTKKALVMDGLGDALVVLVNITALIDWPPRVIAVMLNRARERFDFNVPFGDSHRLFHKMRLSFTLMNDLIYCASDLLPRDQYAKPQLGNDLGIDFEEQMVKALWYMEGLARAYEVSLEECFSLAWDEIKDRKGFLNADGIFVKEADA